MYPKFFGTGVHVVIDSRQQTIRATLRRLRHHFALQVGTFSSSSLEDRWKMEVGQPSVEERPPVHVKNAPLGRWAGPFHLFFLAISRLFSLFLPPGLQRGEQRGSKR